MCLRNAFTNLRPRHESLCKEPDGRMVVAGKHLPHARDYVHTGINPHAKFRGTKDRSLY
jgi:hypothetical protein